MGVKMEDIFRDGIWQFIGAILAFFSIVIAIIIYLAQRSRKKLSYEIISSETVVSAKYEFSEKIQILFQGQRVSEVNLLILKFTNSGNTPITSNDFEQSLSIKFNKLVNVLAVEITETVPGNLKVEFSGDKDVISIAPLLLNSGDTFSIKVLLGGFQSDVIVDGRIVGVKTIEKKEDNPPSFDKFGRTFAILWGIATLLSYAVDWLSLDKSSVGYKVINIIIGGSAIFLIIYLFSLLAYMLGKIVSRIYQSYKN
jgi:hypothetical protein